MKKISVAQIRKHEPCYDPTEIEGITEKTKMTLLDWMNYKAEKLTDIDKVWLFSKIGTNLQRRKFAIWCARQCETARKEIKEYIDTAEKYYIYKIVTKKELDKAYSAAYKTAYWVAYWAADNKADCVTYNAAYRAAYNAACRATYWAAYRAAYWAADRIADSAAKSEVRKKQVEKIKELLKEKE